MACFRRVAPSSLGPRRAVDWLERRVLHVPGFTLILTELVELGLYRRVILKTYNPARVSCVSWMMSII